MTTPADFAGSAVVVSHERFFLDRICTYMLAFDGEGHVEGSGENFEDYEADKVGRLGPDAVEPKWIRYKKRAEADQVQEDCEVAGRARSHQI